MDVQPDLNLTVLSMNGFVTIHFITYKTQRAKTKPVWYTRTVSQMDTDHTKRNPCITLKTAQPPTWHLPSGCASRMIFIKIQKPYPCFSISLYYPLSRWKTTCKGLGSLLVKYATLIYTVRFNIMKRFPNILMGRFVLGFSSGVSL